MDSALIQNTPGRDTARTGSGQSGHDVQLRAWYGSPGAPAARKRAGGPDGRTPRGPSTLVQRNIAVGSHRTTVRLEPAMWDALGEICQREDVSLNELCSRIADRRSASSLTATVRVFVMSYFRAAATEEGHARTGHGLLYGAQRP